MKYIYEYGGSTTVVSTNKAFTCCECGCTSAEEKRVQEGKYLVAEFRCPSCGNTWELDVVK